MSIYNWSIELAKRILLPLVYALQTHYQTDYHGLLLARGR